MILALALACSHPVALAAPASPTHGTPAGDVPAPVSVVPSAATTAGAAAAGAAAAGPSTDGVLPNADVAAGVAALKAKRPD